MIHIMKKLILIVIPSLFFICCKNNDDSEPEDTTWRDKSAKEKLDSMKFSPVLENASDKISGFQDQINSVMLIVNYDDEGNLWLTGLGASSQKKVNTVSELSRLLSLVALKGDAGISQTSTNSTERNSDLEEKIMAELRNQGFNISEIR